MQRIQLDTFNLNAQFLVPQLPPLPNEPFYSPARAQLDDWDFTQPPDSSQAAYFNAFWRNLLALTFDDELPPELWPNGGDRWFEVIRKLWADPTNAWWDDKTTQGAVESRDEIVLRALRAARDELTRLLAKDPDAWEWGRLHTLELENPSFGTSGIGFVESLFNRGPLRLGGGSSLVDATAWDAAEGYEVTAVPSMRMVVDMADLDGSQWVNLTGQSDHIYHQNYVDQVDMWRDGRYSDWAWTADAVKEAAKHTLTLRPPEPDDGG
jgi:penicillin amidase